MKRQRGFTLIELIVLCFIVIIFGAAIVGILSTDDQQNHEELVIDQYDHYAQPETSSTSDALLAVQKELMFIEMHQRLLHSCDDKRSYAFEMHDLKYELKCYGHETREIK